jgi:hypothetical protein
MRKSWILVIFMAFLITGLLYLGPITQTVKAQEQPTGSYSDNFSNDSGLWQYLGSAYRDSTNEYLVLTTAEYDEGGVAFFNAPIQGPFTANFSYLVGGGNCHGDGFTMFFYKQQYSDVGNGGSLAFSPNYEIAPGYGIEFDGWQNIPQDFQNWGGAQQNPQGDPSAAYIGLIQDFAGNHLAYVNDQRVDDNCWHNVSVVVGESSVNVLVDQGLVLQWTGALNTTYTGFGFSGATGGGGENFHIIGNFSIILGAESIPTVTPTPTSVANSTPASTSSPTPSPVPVEFNQSFSTFSDDFSTDTGAWQYLGSAYRDPASQDLVLTTSSVDQTGVAFFNAPIQGSFVANFSYKAGGGDTGLQNDGFVMFFYKQQYPSNLDYVDSYGANAVAGGRLGFNSGSIIPGYGIEFDGWQNIASEFDNIVGGTPNPTTGDPSASYIGLVKDFTGDHLAYANDQRVCDNVWHQVSVVVQGSSVAVYVDQGLALQWTGVLDRTYDGFGFSGSNGEIGGNWHIIANFSITAQNLQQPSITTSCVSSVSQSNLNVEINGNLTFNGTGIPGAPILLSYSVTGGESWQDLTLLNTAADGSYSALWFPTVTGNYLLKAVYQGNENYLGTTNTVSFVMEPCTEQSIFSVTSNSTISEFSFNPTNEQLCFTVSGPTGTTGYVDMYIPKSLINDITGLQVYVDNNQINYAAQSLSDCWLLHFTYRHSTHLVTINFGSLLTPTSSSSPAKSPSPTSAPAATVAPFATASQPRSGSLSLRSNMYWALGTVLTITLVGVWIAVVIRRQKPEY